MNAGWQVCGGLAAALIIFTSQGRLQGQSFPEPPTWTYALVEGSQLIDDCVCGRPPIALKMRGSFQLKFDYLYPFSASGQLQSIQFQAGLAPGPVYTITGTGSFFSAWEMGAYQTLTLDVNIADAYTNMNCYFTNHSPEVGRRWPMLQVQANQTNASQFQQFTLQINAAPLREIWFATGSNFTAGVWSSPSNLVRSGDLLSSAGVTVKSKEQLTAPLGVQTTAPDCGLYDFDILPGGEVAFSLSRDLASQTLGAVHAGDLLSDHGQVLGTNNGLVARFEPQPPLTNGLGLAAVQILDSGEIYFSVRTNFFSSALGRLVKSSDLLSDHGQIIRTGEQLISGFCPASTNTDFGLNSVYVWPSGEIWFSVGQTFTTTNSESYGPGDLLSDGGYRVCRNLDLLAAFRPVEDVSSFPLEGLYVVSDTTGINDPSGTSSLAPPQLVDQPPGSMLLQWQSRARAFQVETALSPNGPFSARSSIAPDMRYVDPGALTNQTQLFYRVKQWW